MQRGPLGSPILLDTGAGTGKSLQPQSMPRSDVMVAIMSLPFAAPFP